MEINIRPLDIAAVVLYLGGMLAIGAYSARRSRSADNYFVGSRNFPGWVVALSMLATIVSSTTFLALPAAAYVLDWRQLSVNLVVPFVAVFAVVFFIPFFRRAGLTSAFEYLGDRFGVPARIYGTVSFVVLQLIRVAQVLFLVALPLQFLTGAPIAWVIVGAGVFVALYSIFGGMEAVLWAGMAQAIIMLVGGVFCLWFVAKGVPGGFSQVIEVGSAHGKFSLGSMDWNVHQRTFWTVVILGLVNWLNIYSGEQTIVQRYVSAKSLYEARKATLLFSWIALPMWTMFFFIGTALWVFFQVSPDASVAGLQPDQILPYFILTHIPVGIAGLVIAGVIAAAMSSLDSGINSISTVVVIDLIKPHFAKGRPDDYYLKAARVVSAVAVVSMTVGALSFSRMHKESMNDVSLIVFSVLGGCLTGLYMVGFFTKRVDGFSVNVALLVAVGFNMYLGLCIMDVIPGRWQLGVHSYWVGALVNLVFVFVAYGVSLFRRQPNRNLAGLTMWTKD
jgi:SSS family solute:Na+ symporter